jgi:pimeloyl-ACP methyl ester carboxylesterase
VTGGERIARVGELDVCYETFGSPERPTLLLVMGLGFQLIHWPRAFCMRPAAAGFHVVRFDNRDAGRSTHLPGRRYTLEDIVDNARAADPAPPTRAGLPLSGA